MASYLRIFISFSQTFLCRLSDVIQLRRGLLEAATFYHYFAVRRRRRSSSPHSRHRKKKHKHSNKEFLNHPSLSDASTSQAELAPPPEPPEIPEHPRFNVDVEAIEHLLIPPSDPRQVKVVTWLLCQSPPLRKMPAIGQLMRRMAQLEDGRVALIILLVAEQKRTHATRFEERADPFKEVLREFSNVMCERANVNFMDSPGHHHRNLFAVPKELPKWRTQSMELYGGSYEERRFETVEGCPRLFLLHLLSWVEVLARAVCSERGYEFDSSSSEGDEEDFRQRLSPKVDSITKQLEHLIPPMELQKIMGNLDSQLRPSHRMLRALQGRYEAYMEAYAKRKLRGFVHELMYSSIINAVLTDDEQTQNDCTKVLRDKVGECMLS